MSTRTTTTAGTAYPYVASQYLSGAITCGDILNIPALIQFDMKEIKEEGSEDLLIALFKAYFDARKNKRGSINQLKFEINFETNVCNLYQEILQKTYKVSPGIAFIINDPVKREILAADFRDRVVHHLVFNLLNPIFEPLFIEESFSCRKRKGTSKGIETLKNAIKCCSENYKKDCYVLKLDIAGYFMSIDKEILEQIIIKDLKKSNAISDYFREIALFLIKAILEDDPTKSCIIKGSINDWKGLPSSKSLFSSPSGHGLPIGNLTSQLFSNIYLNSFDHFVKEELKISHYGRYVDDFYLVHKNRNYLLGIIPKIKNYLAGNLGLVVHPNKQYFQHYSKGVKFLGAVIKPNRTYISKRIKTNFIKKIRHWEGILAAKSPQQSDLHQLRSCLNSYLGLMQPHRTFNIRKKVLFSKNAEILLKYGFITYVPHRNMTFKLYRKNR